MDSRRVVVILGIVGVVGLCACSALAILLLDRSDSIRESLERFVFNEIETDSPNTPASTRVVLPTLEATQPTDGTPPSQESTTVPAQSIVIDAEVLAQMEEIETQVSQLRGLNATDPVERSLLSPADLYQYVLDDFLDEYSEEEAIDDALVLSLFGILEPEFDLFNFYLELYSEQIAGFYDDEVKKMFVVQESEFRGIERLTYAHEYVHALQDQVWGFEEGLNYNDESCELDSERCAGISALVEGDATLLEEQWLLEYAKSTDIGQILEFYESYESPVYDSAPAFMQQDFLFPYTYGTDFVREIHSQGGWPSIDQVYSDPPVSTEQILHPERYPWDTPIEIQPPDLEAALAGAWREIEFNVLGEWFTQLVLSEYVSDDLAIVAAEGWGGDVYVAMVDEGSRDGALFLMTIWDSARDAQEFAAAFLDYGDARFGNRQVELGRFTWESAEGLVLFERSGNQTLWVLAPDEDTVNAIRSAANFPLGN